MKRVLAIVLLLAVNAFGQPYPDTITITSADLPYTIPNNFTAYRIAPNILQSFRINSTTNGIIVNSKHDIEIFGQYQGSTPGEYASLNFCSGGGDARYGILLASSYNVTIKNLNIYAGMGTLDDDNDSGNACIRITGGTHNVLFENGGMYPDGLDGKGVDQIVDAGYNSYNLDFNGVNHYQYSNKFTRRDYYMASLMKFEFSAIIEPPDYHVRIRNCTFERSIHVAVAISGSQVPTDSGALALIYDNEFHQQGRNDRYTTFTDNATQSLGDNFAMSFIGLRRGSEIHDNLIYGDNVASHYGGSGILIQGACGWPDEPVRFWNNEMVLRSGRHIALSALKQATQGFYIRALDGILANRHLQIYNNNIQIYVDTSQASTSTGRVAEGIRILMDSLSHDIVITENHVSINRVDSAAGLGNGSGESELITSAITIAQQTEVDAGELSIFHNYFGDWGRSVVRFGSNREASYGGNNVYLLHDTLALYANNDTTFWFETVGSYIDHSTNNIHQDCIFGGYASPYDITFGNASAADSLGKSVEHWQTVRLVCLDSDGDPVPNISIYYANAYREGLLGVSNYLGILEQRVKVRYDHRDYLTDTYNPGDSIFNPFTFTGYTQAMDDSVEVTMTVSPTVFVDTLVFTATTGTVPPSGNLILIRNVPTPAHPTEVVGPPVP